VVVKLIAQCGHRGVQPALCRNYASRPLTCALGESIGQSLGLIERAAGVDVSAGPHSVGSRLSIGEQAAGVPAGLRQHAISLGALIGRGVDHRVGVMPSLAHQELALGTCLIP
jgi:hypothetical protein